MCRKLYLYWNADANANAEMPMPRFPNDHYAMQVCEFRFTGFTLKRALHYRFN